MPLWEITLATAYFLGLKRTYKLALQIQRRLIPPNYYKLRQFLHRRTRAVFDVALSFHRKVQERDIEVGRNLGNWILRWLDRMKPSAQIRAPPSETPGIAGSTSISKHVGNGSNHQTHKNTQRSSMRGADGESNRHLFTSSTQIWPRPFPTIGKMMQTPRPVGMSIQYRQFICGPEVLRSSYGRCSFEGVIRKDIMQWLQRD